MKTKLKRTPDTPPFAPGWISFLTLWSPHRGAQGMGTEGLVNLWHFISAAPSSPPCSPVMEWALPHRTQSFWYPPLPLSQLLPGIFNPFLNMFSQRCHQRHPWAQLWPVLGLLKTTGPSCFPHGVAQVFSKRGHPCSQNLTTQPPNRQTH